MLPPSGGIFDYDRKIVEIQDEENITHQADFWNNSKEAETILKNIRTKKIWTDAYENVERQIGDLDVLNEFHEAGDVAEEELDKEARKRLRSYLDLEQSSTSSHGSYPKPSAPPYAGSSGSDLRDDPEKTVYIRKIEVLLNGTPIDQVEDKQNEDECIQAYWRMFTFNGQMNSLFTNGIRKI